MRKNTAGKYGKLAERMWKSVYICERSIEKAELLGIENIIFFTCFFDAR